MASGCRGRVKSCGKEKSKHIEEMIEVAKELDKLSKRIYLKKGPLMVLQGLISLPCWKQPTHGQYHPTLHVSEKSTGVINLCVGF